MNESSPTENVSRLRRINLRSCFLRFVIGITAAVVVIVLFIEFVGSIGSGSSDGRSEFIAGPADEFALADVNAFEPEHILLVRYQDGSFRAFYDKSSKQQEVPGETCRIFYEETAAIGTLEQTVGMRGAFVEECVGVRSVWRVDGAYSFGGNYGDLDEFGTRIDETGALVVMTDTRSCTRSVGVAGIPPFERKECAGAP